MCEDICLSRTETKKMVISLGAAGFWVRWNESKSRKSGLAASISSSVASMGNLVSISRSSIKNGLSKVVELYLSIR